MNTELIVDKRSEEEEESEEEALGVVENTDDGESGENENNECDEEPPPPLVQLPMTMTDMPPAPVPPHTYLEKLEAVYDAELHLSDETQLDSGIASNKQWQVF